MLMSVDLPAQGRELKHVVSHTFQKSLLPHPLPRIIQLYSYIIQLPNPPVKQV